uniref:Uncharacterized protein n=1 Tax=Percolomonas cosmopolitus TaxID=63605 RepID=A0A7S1KQN5_9EUKA|mmetsp:Transcript_5280/g.19740  ORF Transcript_5280/g.19740 Transcript_5280/m.19740 type:complete len:436 (+) Transcript_5280:1-1308(+)
MSSSSTTIYSSGGEEIYALVLSIGTNNTTIGFAGESSPRSVFPSYVGVSQAMSDASSASSRFVGAQKLSFRRDNVALESPLTDGIITNFDHAHSIVEHAVEDRLGLKSSEHPVLMSEVSFNTMEAREKTISMLFERFDTPAVYMAKSAVLSAFAAGKQTALVLDSGAGITCVSPVYDGYVLNQGVVYNTYAGNYVTDQLLKQIQVRGSVLRPTYTYRKHKLAEGEFKLDHFTFPKTHPSYERWSLRNLLEDVKSSLFKAHEEPWRPTTHTPIVEYELPDENKLSVGAERFSVPEEFFTPSALEDKDNKTNKVQESSELDTTKTKLKSKCFHVLAHSAIMRSPADVRKELFSTSILTGGNTLIQGIAKRFENELTTLAPQNIRVKAPIASANANLERRCSEWVGGSILGSLGSFQNMWISRAQYEEHGDSIVLRLG